MPKVLITGANRGLGLEFAKQYSKDGWDVVTTVREPSPELEALGVQIEHLDMADLDAVAGFGEKLDALDLLVGIAGTYGPKEAESAEDAEGWLATMRVNTVAPYLLARSVLPLVQQSGGKLVAVSTKMGSIEDNSSGGFLAYRSSKAALNMAWRNLALEVGRSGLGADADGRKFCAPPARRKRRRNAARHRRARTEGQRRVLRLRRQPNPLVIRQASPPAARSAVPP